MTEKLKHGLELREMHIASRNGYYCIDAEWGSETVLAGLTRKLANLVLGAIHGQITKFCRMNKLATLLAALEELEPVLITIANAERRDPDDKQASCEIYVSSLEQENAQWLLDWLKAHELVDEEGHLPTQYKGRYPGAYSPVSAYLSLDNENYDDESERRERTKQR